MSRWSGRAATCWRSTSRVTACADQHATLAPLPAAFPEHHLTRSSIFNTSERDDDTRTTDIASGSGIAAMAIVGAQAPARRTARVQRGVAERSGYPDDRRHRRALHYAVPDFIALTTDARRSRQRKLIARGAVERPRVRAGVRHDSARHLPDRFRRPNPDDRHSVRPVAGAWRRRRGHGIVRRTGQRTARRDAACST